MRTLLVVAALASPAHAAPSFATYVIPNMSIDVLPITQSALNGQRAAWNSFLSGKGDDWSPSQHIASVRLVDLAKPDGTPYGGWSFSVVVPTAPSPWKAPALEIKIGGVSLDALPRRVELGSLIQEVRIDRGQLKPGAYKVQGTSGAKLVFEVELVLEDGVADDPEPIATSRAAEAAAAKRPAFLVAALPARPDCASYPPVAGCTRGATKIWRQLFTDTLAGHRHTTRFVKKTKPAGTPNGASQVQWPAYLVFPTGPAGWSQSDPAILLDGKPVVAPHLRLADTDALIVELKLFEGGPKPGKHALRAVDAAGNQLFASEIELAP